MLITGLGDLIPSYMGTLTHAACTGKGMSHYLFICPPGPNHSHGSDSTQKVQLDCQYGIRDQNHIRYGFWALIPY